MNTDGLFDYAEIKAMTQRDLFIYSGGLPCRLIDRAPGKPYLERYFLGQGEGITYYLHRFVAADIDEDTHDHPWEAQAECLHGGYREEVVQSVDFLNGGVSVSSRWILPGVVNSLSSGGLTKGTFHRICEAKPETWTLFAHTDRKGSWGFLLPDSERDIRYVHWRKHVEGVHGPISDEDPDKNHWWDSRPLGVDSGRQPFAL